MLTMLTYVLPENNTVKAQSVTMGEIIPNQQVELVSDLQSSDHILVEGAAYLKDGDSVNIFD